MSIFTRKIILIITDVVLINIAFVLALLVRFELKVPSEQWINYLNLLVLFTGFKLVIYYFFGLYSSLWRYAGVNEILKVMAAVSLGSIGAICFCLLIGVRFPHTVHIISWMFSIILIGGSRLFYRFVRSFIRNNSNHSEHIKRVMIIGGGDAGAMLIKELQEYTEGRYKPVAVIDDSKWKWGSKIHGVAVQGGMNKILEVASKERVEEIIIAIPSIGRKALSRIVKICQKTDCKLKTLPCLYDIVDNKVTVKNIRDVSIEDLLGREEVMLNTNEISSYLEDEVVLVTGGGGSIGSELCRQIAKFKPKKLIILDIYENSVYELQYELKRIYSELNLDIVIASVRDKERMRSVFKKYCPGVVFHAAAHKHVHLMEDNPGEAYKNNILGTLAVARCADEFQAKRFVLISTDKAVNPSNIMGASKRIAEMIIQSIDRVSKTEFVAVRFGNVLGSNGSVIPLFKNQIAAGGPVTVTHREVTRYFMTIPEASRLVIQAGAMAKGGEIFVLDMGEPVKIVDLARDLIRLSGFIPDEDIKIEFTGLKPGEKLYEELLLKEEGITATRQKGIFIAAPRNLVFSEIMDMLRMLENSSEDEEVLRKNIFRIVMNSAGSFDVAFEEKELVLA